MIATNRSYFGDFDPFGDLDMLFGAAKYNLKIIDLPVRYRERRYGSINIQRWRHGWLLLGMVLLAMLRIKFVYECLGDSSSRVQFIAGLPSLIHYSAAPKGTILELFSAISWRVCHRWSSLLD
jgi:hypothetical protein